MDAIFRHGDPVMVDYTPTTGNVAVGQVVIVGSGTTNAAMAGICHEAIANNALGALAMGGGVYDCVNENNAANGAKAYWDAANHKVTNVGANNATFGSIVSQGGLGANTICRVLHDPAYGGV
jgi:hypothetical protein